MKLFAVILFASAVAVWGAGVTDCSVASGSQGVLSLEEHGENVHGLHDGGDVVLEGVVTSVHGQHGKRLFFLQSGSGEHEVMVVAPFDVDMAMHEGKRARVEGTLDVSTSKGLSILLLDGRKDIEESVLLCDQPVHRRQLLDKVKVRGYYADGSTMYLFLMGGLHRGGAPEHYLAVAHGPADYVAR